MERQGKAFSSCHYMCHFAVITRKLTHDMFLGQDLLK